MRATFFALALSTAAIGLSGCCGHCLSQEDIAEQTAIPQPARINPQPGAETPANAADYPGYSNTDASQQNAHAGAPSTNPSSPTTQPTTEPATAPAQ